MDDDHSCTGHNVGLAPLQMTDKAYFDSVFRSLGQPLSDYSFANTFAWSSSLKLSWAAIDRHLCVFANGTGDLTMLMPPLPEAGASDADSRGCLRTCFEVMDAYNDRISDRSRSRIEYVSQEMADRLTGLCDSTRSSPLFGGDYIYDMQKMIDLDGKALKSKRHSRSKFMRDYPEFRTEIMRDEHVEACLSLLNLWCLHGDVTHIGEVNEDQVGSEVLRHKDLAATESSLRYRTALGLTGMVLYVGDNLVGFTLGERLGSNQASILIEKTHPDYHGAAQYIFSEFCRLAWADLPECNVGDDWGIPSLRFTKQSYRPIRQLSKFILTLNRPVMVPIVHPEVPVMIPASSEVAEVAAAAMADAPVTLAPAPPQEVLMRRATVADRRALMALENACFANAAESFNKRQIRYLITSPTAIVTVAELDGSVIGWSVGLLRQHKGKRSGRIYAVAVSPDHQGRGLGRRLLENSITLLRQHGAGRIYLEVRHDNHNAIALYQKVGFANHRFLPAYYGTDVHGVRMKLMVEPAATEPAMLTPTPATETGAGVAVAVTA